MIAAVVPVKRFAAAKQRLSGVLPARARQVLARTMLDGVLAALRESASAERVYVVTADRDVAAFAARRGAEHIAEDAPAGQSGAVATAVRFLEARGIGTMMTLPGDVPLVTAAEIDALASSLPGRGIAIAPAHDRDGSNALLLAPPGAISFSFGPGSFALHMGAARAAGIEPAICVLEGAARDIDNPEDLRVLVKETAARPEYAFLRAAMEETDRKEPQNA